MAFNFIKPKEVEEAERVKAQDEQKLRNFEVYTPQQYQQSQGLKDMWDKVSNWQIPTWNREDSTWWGKLTNTMSDIENRKPFTYDLNGDMLYQQYKNQYTRLGDLAMRDTMGQAAALTGGYGNSYAQTVGQQTYQGYLQQLNDKIPELYQLALDKYNREGDELYNRLSAYGNLYNTEYGEHRDTVADSKDERANLVNLYGIKSDEEYGQWSDYEQRKMTASQQELDQLSTILGISTENAANLLNFAYQSQFDTHNSEVDDRNFAYQQERDAVADRLATDQLNEQIRANKASEALAWEKYNDSKVQAAKEATAKAVNAVRDKIGTYKEYFEYHNNIKPGDENYMESGNYNRNHRSYINYRNNAEKVIDDAYKNGSIGEEEWNALRDEFGL